MFNKLNQIFKNNKTFSAVKIDGFLTATISAPNLIHPLQLVKITKIENSDLAILFDFYNQIYCSLKEGSYLPIFSKLDSVENLSTYVNNWGNGYILGKNLWDPFIVKIHQIEINKLLFDIEKLLADPINLPDNLMDIIPKSCIGIYEFWAKQSFLYTQR